MFTEPRAKAEVLNSQFSSVFNKEETENIPHPGESPIPTIGSINITTSGVEKQLSGLKADKAYGPDGIPSWLKGKCPGNIRRFLLIYIKIVLIPELCLSNGNTPTCALSTRKERNRILQIIGPCHLPALHQRYLSTLYTAML